MTFHKATPERPGALTLGEVIAEGLCTGCGACAFARPEALQVAMNEDGYYSASPRDPDADLDGLETLCPFTGAGRDEDEIAQELFPEAAPHPQIGRVRESFACHVVDDSVRMAGGSGALVTWLAARLLSEGHVDGVVHLRPAAETPGPERLFEYAISRTVADVHDASKSRYYPVTLVDVLAMIAADDSRYALIAVPCFAKAVRALQHEGHLTPGKVPIIIGLVCGHLKSRYFAEYLAWQKAVRPGALTGFDFRTKLEDRAASDYGFTLRTDAGTATYPMATVRGRDWGEGQFKLPACEYCDDVLAECADIAIGDAWLPRYVGDPRGTNIVVNRSAALAKVIDAGRASGALQIEAASADEVVQSQASGLRHRREGLAHRLARRVEQGKPVPPRRVAPRLADTPERRSIYDLRERIAVRSNGVFGQARAAGDIGVYERGMRGDLRRLRRFTRGSVVSRLVKKIRRRVGL